MDFQPAREEQLTEKNLKWGYWWVTHKLQVRRAIWIGLAVVDLGLVGFAAFGFADWFFGSGVTERQLMGTLSVPVTDYAFFRTKNAPRELTVEGASAFLGGDKSYDAVARVTNPNLLWWADFDFAFITPVGKTPLQHGYVLPNETRSMAALGIKDESAPGGSAMVMENLVWHRVNQHVTRPDFVTWATARLGIQVSESTFVPPAATDAVPVSRARFTVTNATGFGYYKVGFFVTLLSGGRVVGVNKVTISDLRAGERRPVEASWYTDIPAVSAIEVMPEVNIFDERIYIPPGQ